MFMGKLIKIEKEKLISIRNVCLELAIRITPSGIYSETATGSGYEKTTPESILETAKKFEDYILGNNLKNTE